MKEGILRQALKISGMDLYYSFEECAKVGEDLKQAERIRDETNDPSVTRVATDKVITRLANTTNAFLNIIEAEES